MLSIDRRGVFRQYNDVDSVDHLRLDGSVQPPPDQLRCCPAQSHRSAVGVLLNLREHVLIEI